MEIPEITMKGKCGSHTGEPHGVELMLKMPSLRPLFLVIGLMGSQPVSGMNLRPSRTLCLVGCLSTRLRAPAVAGPATIVMQAMKPLVAPHGSADQRQPLGMALLGGEPS